MTCIELVIRLKGVMMDVEIRDQSDSDRVFGCENFLRIARVLKHWPIFFLIVAKGQLFNDPNSSETRYLIPFIIDSWPFQVDVS